MRSTGKRRSSCEFTSAWSEPCSHSGAHCGCDHTQKTPEPVVDPQAAQQAAINNVVQLVHQHVSDPVIINQIRTSGMIYHLTSPDIEYLKSNGVSDPVVLEMQGTAMRGPQPVAVVGQPAPPPVVGAVTWRHRRQSSACALVATARENCENWSAA